MAVACGRLLRNKKFDELQYIYIYTQYYTCIYIIIYIQYIMWWKNNCSKTIISSRRLTSRQVPIATGSLRIILCHLAPGKQRYGAIPHLHMCHGQNLVYLEHPQARICWMWRLYRPFFLTLAISPELMLLKNSQSPKKVSVPNFSLLEAAGVCFMVIHSIMRIQT